MTDVYPQQLKFSVVMTVPNTYKEAEVITGLPVNTSKGKALVMEILKVKYNFAALINVACHIRGHISTKSNSDVVGYDNPSCISHMRYAQQFETSGMATMILPQEDELGAADKGILFAGAKLFVGVNTAAFTATGYLNGVIVYRIVEVSQEELLGIIASFLS